MNSVFLGPKHHFYRFLPSKIPYSECDRSDLAKPQVGHIIIDVTHVLVY